MIQIRTATENDIEELMKLFVETITTINTKDYNEEQIYVWAAAAKNQDLFLQKIKTQFFYIAEVQNETVGFASLDAQDYFNFLYVHRNHQRKGIATRLLKVVVEKAYSLHLTVIHVAYSITAKPFFEKHGFVVVKQQKVALKNVIIPNYKMMKQLKQPAGNA